MITKLGEKYLPERVKPLVKRFHPSFPRWTKHFDISSGGTVIDVGGKHGDFTGPALRQSSPDGQVYVIEPEPTNIDVLEGKYSDEQRVSLIEAAAMDYSGGGELHLNPTHEGGHSMFEETVGAGQRNRGENINANDKITVDVRTLDDICQKRGISEIDFIKMDIEGGEIAALEGATNTLERTEKIVVEAYHPLNGEITAPKVVEILESHGFTTLRTDDNWVFGEKENR